MIDLAAKAAVERIVINGSFVTEVLEPNDVDCVLLAGSATKRRFAAFRSLQAGLPFLDIALVSRKDFDEIVNVVFAEDRDFVPKGLVEIVS